MSRPATSTSRPRPGATSATCATLTNSPIALLRDAGRGTGGGRAEGGDDLLAEQADRGHELLGRERAPGEGAREVIAPGLLEAVRDLRANRLGRADDDAAPLQAGVEVGEIVVAVVAVQGPQIFEVAEEGRVRGLRFLARPGVGLRHVDDSVQPVFGRGNVA